MIVGRYSFEPPDPAAHDARLDSASVPAAIGHTVVLFEELDEQLSTAIAFLLRRGDSVGRIVTAELSFKGKINLFASLFRHERPESVELASLGELCAACLEVEEKRNKVVHSSWRHTLDGLGMTRVKYTARGKHGLREQQEMLSPGQVDAIWAHCGYLAHSIDELMYLEFGNEYGEP